jgi:hypothetical protein
MSTATTASQGMLNALTSAAKALTVGFGWAAVMLFVLGAWMRSKYAGGSGFVTYYGHIFTIAGAVAAALACWQAFTVWFKKETPDEKTATLSQQRRLFSMILLIAGLAFIALSFALGIGKRPSGSYGFVLDNLGESIGVLLFGLISLGSGYVLSQSTSLETSPTQFLTDKVGLLKGVQVLLAAIALAGFVAIAYKYRLNQEWRDWLPELFALALVSILAVACFLWLNTGGMDEVGIRLFVLIFGGSFGMILFVYSLLRIFVWRNDIIFGGAAAWQGENSWHFWTCVYLQFAALVLMFGSFNLARTDMRSNVVLRRMMYGYDAIVQAMLLAEILAVVNIVVYVLVPYTFDWTQSRGAYAVSDASKNLISNLKQETNIVVLMPPNDPVQRDLRNLLDNFAALSAKLKVTYLSPDADPMAYARYAKQFPVLRSDLPGFSGRGVLLVKGAMPDPAVEEAEKGTYAFVSSEKFTEDDRAAMMRDRGKRKMVFKGEGEIVKELSFLVQGKKRKIYIMQGDDEPDINGEEAGFRPDYRTNLFRVGIGLLAEKLNKDNYEVVGLSFGKEIPVPKDAIAKIEFAKADGPDKRKSVPKDCGTLIVLPTSKPLPQDAIEAIERYMDDPKGRLVAYLDVVADAEYGKLINTGIEPLLKKFGVDVPDSFVVAVRRQAIDPGYLLATPPFKSEQVLARQFIGKTILMKNSARVVKPLEGGPGFKVEPILQVLHTQTSRAIVETDPRALRDLDLHLSKLDAAGQLGPRLSPTPVSVGVAVSKTAGKDGDNEEPRMVVVGDAEFIGNVDLAQARTPVNYSFAASALEWLAERQNIGVQPRENPAFTIDAGVDTARMVILPGWIMLVTLCSLGIGVWVVRRR